MPKYKLATNIIKKELANVNLSSISGSSVKEALTNAFNSLPLVSNTIIGHFNWSGEWMFMAYKYSGGQYGMMLAICYSQYVSSYILNRDGGSDTYRRLDSTVV